MKTPQKVKDKIWQIAEKEGLSDIVIGHGVDRIWELIKEETEDEIFLSYEEACVQILKDLSEPGYYNHDLNEVYCEDRVIAKVFVGKKGHEVRILQGMPRIETMKKLIRDCPDFSAYYHLTENYYPKLF